MAGRFFFFFFSFSGEWVHLYELILLPVSIPRGQSPCQNGMYFNEKKMQRIILMFSFKIID